MASFSIPLILLFGWISITHCFTHSSVRNITVIIRCGRSISSIESIDYSLIHNVIFASHPHIIIIPE
jgi:hypothetical protein